MTGAGGSEDAGGTGAWIAPVADDGGFARFLETVWAGRWIVLVAVLCAAAGALVYVERAHKVYQAHSQLLVTPVPNDPTTAGLGLIHDTSDPLRDVETGAGFVTDANVAQLVLQRLGLHESTTQLLSQITVTPIAESDIVDIAASSSSPAQARAIASAFATATVDNRTARLHDQLAVLIPRLSTQLAALGNRNAAAKNALGGQLAELDTLSLEPDPTVRVESLASTPTSPTSPRKALTLVAAVFGGLVAGIGLVFVVLLLDPRLRREDQLHRFRLPVLARIPRSKKRRRRHGSPKPITPDAMSPESADAFRALRSVLGARGRARGGGRVVLVTGSCPLDGKTTTAINLAATLAESPQRVMLIEADLRRPSIGSALALDAEANTGNIMYVHFQLRDAVVTTTSEPVRLRLLLANGNHAGDRALVPPTFERILAEARSTSDWVVVDAPPLIYAPHLLAAAGLLDDVLIVVRLGNTNLRRLDETGEMLAHHGIRPAGFVVIGTTNRPGYYGKE